MSSTGLDVLDKTLQVTNLWLDEIVLAVGCDRPIAWNLLALVLRQLRDRMSVELTAHFGAELPLLVRGAYYDRFTPERQPTKDDLDELLLEITGGLPNASGADANNSLCAVLAVLSSHLPRELVAEAQDAVSEKLRVLWRSAEQGVIPH